MIKDYSNFLNESLSLKDIAVGDFILIKRDKESEKYGDFKFTNQIGERLEYKHDKNYLRIRFLNKIEDLSRNEIYYYIPSNNIEFEIIDPKLIEDYKNKRIMSVNFSDSLSYILNKIKFIPKIYFSDIGYFDISEKNNEITYLPLNKITVEKPWKEGRTNMRLGRFLKKLNPDLNEAEIEKISNLYKAEFDLMTGLRIEIVKGEEIRYWYLEERYAIGNGKLNNSCMRYKESQQRFDLYCENPDKIRMAILKDDKGKLLGRALIWKVDKPKETIYMDRVYTVSDHLDNIFIEYAKHNKFKSYAKEDYRKMSVFIELDVDDPHPYMDTFKYYYMKEKKLKTYEDDNLEYGEDYMELDDAD